MAIIINSFPRLLRLTYSPLTTIICRLFPNLCHSRPKSVFAIYYKIHLNCIIYPSSIYNEMQKQFTNIINMVAILLLVACSSSSLHNEGFEAYSWKITENNSHQSSFINGELLNFNSSDKTCNWGNSHNLSYYTNDSLLLIEEFHTQRIFKITYNNSMLVLEELYTSDKKKITFKAIKN